jgi:hypothetical protein
LKSCNSIPRSSAQNEIKERKNIQKLDGNLTLLTFFRFAERSEEFFEFLLKIIEKLREELVGGLD